MEEGERKKRKRRRRIKKLALSSLSKWRFFNGKFIPPRYSNAAGSAKGRNYLQKQWSLFCTIQSQSSQDIVLKCVFLNSS
jgi:hypothetical protein